MLNFVRTTTITFQMTNYRTNRYDNSLDEYNNTTYRTINQSYRSLRYILHPGYEKSTISRKREISYYILCAVYDIFGGQVPDAHGCALQLMKSMYGTRQAAPHWHVRISTWMEEHGHLAVNSENTATEKTIFMRHAGEEWIMNGLFVDDMIHAHQKRALPVHPDPGVR